MEHDAVVSELSGQYSLSAEDEKAFAEIIADDANAAIWEENEWASWKDESLMSVALYGDLLKKLIVLIHQYNRRGYNVDALTFIANSRLPFAPLKRADFSRFIDVLEGGLEDAEANIMFMLNFIYDLKCSEEKNAQYACKNRNQRVASQNAKNNIGFGKAIILWKYFLMIDALWRDGEDFGHMGTLSKKQAIGDVWKANNKNIKRSDIRGIIENEISGQVQNGTDRDSIASLKNIVESPDVLVGIEADIRKMTVTEFSAIFNRYLSKVREKGSVVFGHRKLRKNSPRKPRS